MQSAAHSGAIPALLRSVEGPDRSLRSGGHALRVFSLKTDFLKIRRLKAGFLALFVVSIAYALVVAASVAGLGGLARAEDRYLDVRRGEFTPVSVAVTPFSGD